MQTISDVTYEDLYRIAMNGIGLKVAMQSIRKVMRDGDLDDEGKLRRITTIIHSFEHDMKED